MRKKINTRRTNAMMTTWKWKRRRSLCCSKSCCCKSVSICREKGRENRRTSWYKLILRNIKQECCKRNSDTLLFFDCCILRNGFLKMSTCFKFILVGTSFIDIADIYCFGTGFLISRSKTFWVSLIQTIWQKQYLPPDITRC